MFSPDLYEKIPRPREKKEKKESKQGLVPRFYIRSVQSFCFIFAILSTFLFVFDCKVVNFVFYLGKAERQRNVIADERSHNKWAAYRQRVVKQLSILRTQTHFVDVMTQKKRESTFSADSKKLEISEVASCLKKIDDAKQAILNIFHEIGEENKTDRVFPELSAEGDESGLIDIDQVSVTLCHNRIPLKLTRLLLVWRYT